MIASPKARAWRSRLRNDVVRAVGYVQPAPDLHENAKDVNGFSDLIVEIWGDAGRHAIDRHHRHVRIRTSTLGKRRRERWNRSGGSLRCGCGLARKQRSTQSRCRVHSRGRVSANVGALAVP
jgi:hypothetical protein